MKENEISGDELEKLKALSNPIFWRKYFQTRLKIDKDVYFEFLLFFETLTELEKKVLHSYLSGFKQREIGEGLKIRQQKVSIILTNIKTKFLKKI